MDARSIDIFVRAHDEASKVLAKIAAETRAFKAATQGDIRAQVQGFQDLAKQAKIYGDTRARESAKADESIRKGAETTAQFIQRQEAKSQALRDQLDARRIAGKQKTQDRIDSMDEVAAKRAELRDRAAVERSIADAEKLATLRDRLNSARSTANAKGGNSVGSSFLFTGASDAVRDLDRIESRLGTLETRLRHTGRVGAAEMGALGDALHATEGDMAKLGTRSEQLIQNMGGLRGAFEGISNSAAESGGPLARFGSLVQIAVVLMAPLVGGLIQLGAALFAVGAAAGVAAAGIGGVFIAAIAEAIPVIGLAIIAFASLMKVLQISSQQQKASVNDAAKAGQANKTAADHANQLANAQQNVVDAQKRLADARKAAIRQLQDLTDKERQALLASKEANLSVTEAQLALSRAVSGADSFAVLQAQNDLEGAKINASQQGRDTTRTVADAQQTRAQGVNGNDQVVSAKNALAQAERSLSDAQKASAASANNLSAQDARLAEQIKRLTPEQRKLLNAVNDFRKVLAGPEFSKITDIVTEPITRLVHGLTNALKDPRIIGALTATAKTYAGVFDHFASGATGNRARGFFAEMAKDARENAPLLKKSIDSISSIFAKISLGAAPLLNRLFKSFADNLGGLDKRLTQSKLNDFFKKNGSAEKSIRAFLDLLSAFGSLLGNLGGASAGQGVGMIERLTSAIDDVNKKFSDPAFVKRVKDFFDSATKGAGDFIAAIGHLAEQLIEHIDTKSLQKLSDIITKVLVPAMLNLVQISTKISDFFQFLGRIPGAPQVLAVAATVAVLTKAFGLLGPAVKLAGAAMELFGVEGEVAMAIGPLAIVAAIIAVIAILVLLEQRFHIFEKLWDFVKANWKTAVDFLLNLMRNGFLGPFGRVIAAVVDHFDDIVKAFKKVVKVISGLVHTDWANVWKRFKGVVSGVKDDIAGIFDTIANKFIDGMNLIIGGINAFARLINKVLPGNPIGQIGTIGHVGGGRTAQAPDHGGSAPAFASGGWVTAKQGGQLIRAGEAGFDEVVLSTDPRMKARNTMLLAEFNSKTSAKVDPAQGVTEGDPGNKVRSSGGGGRPSIGGRGAQSSILHLIEMLREADKLDGQNYPYSWGGGHVTPARPTGGIGGSPSGHSGVGIIGYDCSSSVSRVLQQAYPGMPTMTSGMFPGYGSLFKPGQGEVTVWSNPNHVFMDIAGRRWGTGANSRGGPGWHDHSTGAFTPVHPKDLGHGSIGGSSFLGRALKSAEGLGGKALEELAAAIGQITSFAQSFGPNFSKMFGGNPDNPYIGGIYKLVKSGVAKAVEAVVGINIPGFAEGGYIPGATGAARLVMAHGGEAVLNRANQNKLTTTGSGIVDELLRKIFGTVDTRSIGISGPAKKMADAAGKFALLFAQLGDKIDALSAAITNQAKAFAHRVAGERFTVNRNGTVTRHDDEATDNTIAAQGVNELVSERGTIDTQIKENTAGLGVATQRQGALRGRYNDLNRRLAAENAKKPRTARGKRAKAANIKKLKAAIASTYAALQAAGADVNGLQARGADLTESRDANIAATADAQDNLLQSRLNVGADEDTKINSSQLRQQLAAGKGDVAGQRAELGIQAGLIQKKIAELVAQQKNYGVGSPQWQQFQDAIVQNQIALQDNTKALDDLTGVNTELQDFSSSPWQMFRRAVFNGLGGLMPKYQIPGIAIPGAAIGAHVLSSGLLQVHSGEKVVPAGVARSNSWGGDTNIAINIDQAGTDVDPAYLAQRMAFEARGL